MIQLDEWQEEVLKTKGDILLCTGRRVGKTYVLARKACEEALQRKMKVVIVSLTEDQAMLIIQVIKDYLTETKPRMIAQGQDKPTLKTVTLRNGSEIISRPVGVTGDSLRGYEADILIVDEASRMPELFWAAAQPLVVTTAGSIWMCSTPHGKQGYFYDKFHEAEELKLPEARFKVFYVTTEQVMKTRPISASWTEAQRLGALKALEDNKRDMSALIYGQEFNGLFLEDLRQYFSDELIARCCTAERGAMYRSSNYMGVDVARLGGDEISYTIIHKNSDTSYIHVENIQKKEQLTTQTEQEIIDIEGIWNCDKVGIDAGSGSLGVGIFDRLRENLDIARKIVAMNNRAISLERDGTDKQRIFKQDMYDNLKNMMERGILTLLNDSNVRASLKSIQMEITEEGKVKIWGNYSHIAESLIRACYLAKKEKVKKFFIAYI